MLKSKESKTKIWFGQFSGVHFEINNQIGGSHDGSDIWTFYLIIHLDRIPKDNDPDSYWLPPSKNDTFRRVHYDYYEHHVLSNIEWHSGITWYSKESGFDGNPRVIKIGCDYNHYWDEGKVYTGRDIELDCQKAIESFLRYVPNYKYWCCGNGNLYNRKEGVIKSDQFYSAEYYGDKDWYKEMTESK